VVRGKEASVESKGGGCGKRDAVTWSHYVIVFSDVAGVWSSAQQNAFSAMARRARLYVS
jgi:hypothetical protein